MERESPSRPDETRIQTDRLRCLDLSIDPKFELVESTPTVIRRGYKPTAVRGTRCRKIIDGTQFLVLDACSVRLLPNQNLLDDLPPFRRWTCRQRCDPTRRS